jgi:ABC-2 type transport system permease protein
MSASVVAERTLRSGARSFAWWSAGLVALVAMMVAVYPTVRDSSGMNDLIASYPEALKSLMGFSGVVDYASAAGYLGGELFSLMVPLLLLIAAIGGGSAAIAGEEEHGTLDLLLTAPITRRRLLAGKLVALVAELAGLGVVLLAALVVGASASGMRIGLASLAAATTMAVLLACVFGAVALMAGAARAGRARAIGLTSAAAVAAYLVNGLAPVVPVLDRVRFLSPFYQYDGTGALRAGLDPVHALALVAAFAIAATLAVVLVDRRDLAG